MYTDQTAHLICLDSIIPIFTSINTLATSSSFVEQIGLDLALTPQPEQLLYLCTDSVCSINRPIKIYLQCLVPQELSPAILIPIN